MQQRRPVRRALLSVSDKAGIVEFAQALSARGVELLSTGGTARLLAEKGLPVTEVSDYTGFPEMMDGRVNRYGNSCSLGVHFSARRYATPPSGTTLRSHRLSSDFYHRLAVV